MSEETKEVPCVLYTLASVFAMCPHCKSSIIMDDFGDNASDYRYDWDQLEGDIKKCPECGKDVKFGSCEEKVHPICQYS
jgi:hypothetical protein